MSIEELKPCPNCNDVDYEYGHQYDLSSKSLVKDAARVAFNPVKSYLSVVKKVYQGVVRDLNGHPVLHCKLCRNLVVCCKFCDEFSIIPEMPKIDELIKCYKCNKKFQPAFHSLKFSKMIDS
jgi:hypothetical protein